MDFSQKWLSEWDSFHLLEPQYRPHARQMTPTTLFSGTARIHGFSKDHAAVVQAEKVDWLDHIVRRLALAQTLAAAWEFPQSTMD